MAYSTEKSGLMIATAAEYTVECMGRMGAAIAECSLPTLIVNINRCGCTRCACLCPTRMSCGECGAW